MQQKNIKIYNKTTMPVYRITKKKETKRKKVTKSESLNGKTKKKTVEYKKGKKAGTSKTKTKVKAKKGY